MNRTELAAALERAGVTSGWHLDGPPLIGNPNDALHIRRDADGRWTVSYFERGRFDILDRFDSEAAACEYVFLKLVSDSYWSPRVRLTPDEKIRADAFRAARVARVRAEAQARRLRAEQGNAD